MSKHEYWFISDTHFGHDKCWSTFKRPDGSPLRNFESTEEMNQTMIDNWNRVVQPNDVVWHLGDVVINRKYLHLLYALNGIKRLIRGNHDIFDTNDYLKHFEEIYGVMKCRDYILSHVPVSENALNGRSWKKNVHGHYHWNLEGRLKHGKWSHDERYINVSVEHIDYTPIHYDQLENLCNEQSNRYHEPYFESKVD